MDDELEQFKREVNLTELAASLAAEARGKERRLLGLLAVSRVPAHRGRRGKGAAPRGRGWPKTGGHLRPARPLTAALWGLDHLGRLQLPGLRDDQKRSPRASHGRQERALKQRRENRLRTGT